MMSIILILIRLILIIGILIKLILIRMMLKWNIINILQVHNGIYYKLLEVWTKLLEEQLDTLMIMV